MGCTFGTPKAPVVTIESNEPILSHLSVHNNLSVHEKAMRERTATEDTAIQMKANLSLCFDANEFARKYREGAILGEGITGTVSIVVNKETQESFAMKTLNKHCVAAAQLSELRNEIEVLKTLDHPNVIRLIETFEDKSSIRLIMERCTGGELTARRFTSEAEVVAVLTQIVQAIAHCHYMGVVHRDLKLENIVFVTPDKSSPIKVIDFGLSRLTEVGQSRLLKSLCGTAYYMAPEMIEGLYTEKSDVWAIGVIAFMLLSGRAPFPGSTEKSVFKRIKRGVISFDGEPWAHVSPFAVSFVNSLLVVDPNARPSASQALMHPWLQGYLENQKLHAEKISPDVAESLCRFAKYNGIRKCALMVIAHHLSHNELKELREVFLAADVDNSGTLTFDQISKLLARFGHSDLDEQSLKKVFSGLHVDHQTSDLSVPTEKLARVHYMEFLAATVETRCAIDAQALKVAFDHMDVDHSGFITSHNLKTVLGTGFTVKEVEDMIAAIDREGRISKDEFVDLMQGGQDKFRAETVPSLSAIGGSELSMTDPYYLSGRITEEPASLENSEDNGLGRISGMDQDLLHSEDDGMNSEGRASAEPVAEAPHVPVVANGLAGLNGQAGGMGGVVGLNGQAEMKVGLIGQADKAKKNGLLEIRISEPAPSSGLHAVVAAAAATTAPVAAKE